MSVPTSSRTNGRQSSSKCTGSFKRITTPRYRNGGRRSEPITNQPRDQQQSNKPTSLFRLWRREKGRYRTSLNEIRVEKDGDHRYAKGCAWVDHPDTESNQDFQNQSSQQNQQRRMAKRMLSPLCTPTQRWTRKGPRTTTTSVVRQFWHLEAKQPTTTQSFSIGRVRTEYFGRTKRKIFHSSQG